MKQLTHNNHFKFGYNSEFWNERKSVFDIWHTDYDVCNTIPDTFINENIKAANLIRESTSLPIYIFYSGGINSEIVLKTFKKAKIDFKVVLLKFKKDYNLHKLFWAKKYLDANQIQYVTIELDLKEFFINEALYYVHAGQVIDAEIPAKLWLINQIDGYPVFGNSLQIKNYRGKRCLAERESKASIARYLIKTNREGCPNFFHYTPSQILSFIQHKENMLDDYKYQIYSKYYDIERRHEYTGYELLKQTEFYQKFQKSLYNLYSFNYDINHIELSSIISKLSPP